MSLPRLGVLGSKVARRVLLFFTLGAAVPVAVMALLSYTAISTQLRQQSEERLSELTATATQSIVERLSGFQAVLASVGPLAYADRVGSAGPGRQPDVPLPPGIVGMALEVDGERAQIAGSFGDVPQLSQEGRARLSSGQAILLLDDQGATALMGAPFAGAAGVQGILWGRIVGDSVWAPAVTRTLDSTITDMCVLDANARPLFCLGGPSSTLPNRVAPVEARSTNSGQLEHRSENAESLVFWRDVFLKASYDAPPLTVVVAEPSDSVYGAGDTFVYNLLLSLLIGVSAALLVTHVLVRRTMEPLEALTVGTRRLAEHDLSTRVEVASQDEFGDLASSFNTMAEQLGLQFKHLEARRSIDHAALTSVDQVDAVQTLLGAVGDLVPGARRALVIPESDLEGAASLFTLDPDGTSIARSIHFATSNTNGLAGLPESGPRVIEAREDVPAPLRPLLEARPALPMLLLPLRAKGISLGAIVVARGAGESFDQEEIERGQQLASQAAVALEKLRLDKELTSMSWEVLRAFANAIDAKSAWTTGHSERVTGLSLVMGNELGLDTQDMETLHRGGLLHDIGKIGVPAEVLDYPGRLDAEMRRLMELHPEAGVRILAPIKAFKPILPIVHYHHERWNGSGYPEGLVGTATPSLARLVAVADVFDAMVSARPYRPALDPDDVLGHIRAQSGSDFDPDMVEVLIRVVEGGWRPQDSAFTGAATS